MKQPDYLFWLIVTWVFVFLRKSKGIKKASTGGLMKKSAVIDMDLFKTDLATDDIAALQKDQDR